MTTRFHGDLIDVRGFLRTAASALCWFGLCFAHATDVAIDPGVGKIVDRNGVLLAEYRIGDDGQPVATNYPLGAFAAQLLYGLDSKVLPKPGEVVYLTLDARVQVAAERALREVGRGAAVVLDPNNGDILAMASVPSFDPNAMDIPALEVDETEPLRNRAIGVNVPGATMLPFTMLAGGAAGVLPKEHSCTGSVRIGNHTLHCWKRGGHGNVDASAAMTGSCNTFFYRVGIDTGGGKLEDAARKLGFGEKTGISVRGENAGNIDGPDHLAKVSPRESWSEGRSATVAIGQGNTLVTPLQVAVAMAAIGNGGTLYRPRLIGKVADGAGTVEMSVEMRGNFGNAGIPADALEITRKGLWGTVNAPEGSGKRARVEGMEVAGRTGTAQTWKRAGGEMFQFRVGWFSGYAPAEKPLWAFSVIVEGDGAGGTSAAPVAAKILEEVRKEVEFASELFVPSRSGPLPQPAIEARD